jgi:hypothetical protein
MKEVLYMPWANNSHERIVKYYTKLLEDISEKKYNDVSFIIEETLIRAEIIKRDFKKRQLNILSLIFIFSYGYGKEWALIPKMMDFELSGISRIKIRKELDELIGMRVIEWKKEEHLFRIKDPREWKGAPYHSGYNDDRSRELFFLNLSHAGIDVTSILKSLNKGE